MSQASLKPPTHQLSFRMKIILAAVVCLALAAIAATITGSATGSAAKTAAKTSSDSFDSLFVDKQAGPASLNPKAAAVSMPLVPAFGPTLLHFNGNPPEDMCTGNGAVDAVGPNSNNCANLVQIPSLSAGPAAKWVAQAELNQSVDRSSVDPNWIWVLSSPTTLRGPMTINWWQTCNAECIFLGADWHISLWADGKMVFDTHTFEKPTTANVPSLLSTTITLPTLTANTKFVMKIDPNFLDTGQGATAYYDSSLPCPGVTTGPCDSTVTMPVVDPNSTPTPTPTPTPAPTPGPCDSLVFGGADKTCAGNPRYQNFFAPAGSSAASNSGEFNIGFDPKTGRIMVMNSGPIWRLTPPELLTPIKPECCEAFWEDKDNPTTNTGVDPILWTDQKSGRTFDSNSTAGANAVYGYSDNDGDQWVPVAISPPNGGVDHETIGSGPYPASLSALVNPAVNQGEMVFYCSQDAVGSQCQRSDDLGASFGPGVIATGPGTTNSQGCGGLHGHVHVAPDGTLWLPDNSCGSNAEGGAFSLDGGTTPWTEFKVPNSGLGIRANSDPSIGIDSASTIYYCYGNVQPGGTEIHAHVAVGKRTASTINWLRDTDVGASHGIVNSVFFEAVGGSTGRAACGFIGTNASGNFQGTGFTGDWYAFIATTYDEGVTWTTVNATPNDPVQHHAGICLLGTGCSSTTAPRNLLDFNEITMDAKGRVLYGYSDGCVSPGCINGTSGNDNVANMRVARQFGGNSLLTQFDPVEPAVPKPACLSGTRDSAASHLKWKAPDNGGSDITGYQISRSTTPGGEAVLVANTGNANTTFDDTTANPAVPHYFYIVNAINGQGTGVQSNEIDLVITATSTPCLEPGLLVVDDTNPDGSDNDSGQNTPPDGSVNIRRLYLAEPFGLGPHKLVFTMQVAPSMLLAPPPNSQWLIVWNALNPDTNFDRRYVAMVTDSTGATSFDFGKFGVPLVPTNPNPNANTPVRLGAADSGSYNQATGVIRIVLDTSKAENIGVGQTLGGLNVRTYFNRPDYPGFQRSQNNASDITGSGNYTLVGNNVGCALGRVNYALSANNGTVIASSTYPSYNFAAGNAIDGDRTGTNWGGFPNSGWNDGTSGVFPDILEVDFPASKAIDEINVVTLQNNWTTAGPPDLTTPATGEGILDFHLETFNGTSWVSIPGCSCSVTGNDKAWRQFTFPAVQMTKFRIVVTNARNGYSRIVELEGVGAGGQP